MNSIDRKWLSKNHLYYLFVFLVFIMVGVFLNPLVNIKNDNEKTFSTQNMGLHPSLQMRTIAYPNVSEILIQHNDNITDYASKGDGLSWETAYIIENFTIFDPNQTIAAIHLENTSYFLTVRNFNIWHDRCQILIRIKNCENIRIENASIYCLDGKSNRGFDVRHSSVVVSNIYIEEINDNVFDEVVDSVLDGITVYNLIDSVSLLMLSSCQNMKIINNSFLNGLYNSEYSPVRVYDSYNISFQENH